MNLLLQSAPKKVKGLIKITGSKSESNRLLLLKALFPGIKIQNLSNSEDSEVMQKGLQISRGEVNIHHAGTAMRFLTAYFSAQAGKEVTLTGSKRMTERPIKILVDVLRELGADIDYLQNEGYPPLLIKGKNLSGGKVSIPGNISSQYISALLLNAPVFPEGLKLQLTGTVTSVPYIKMTLSLLNEIGVATHFDGQEIAVEPMDNPVAKTLTVESDWSSASYFYSILALCEIGSSIALQSYKKDSLQGDSVLKSLYTFFGVYSHFKGDVLHIEKKHAPEKAFFRADLTHAPDIAQTLAVTCFGLGLACKLTGLHTLKIKETDRLEALKTELSKLGATVEVTEKSLHLSVSNTLLPNVVVDTYNDHRMAMSFAPLAIIIPLIIKDARVVAKSYPDFWEDLKKMGFVFNEI